MTDFVHLHLHTEYSLLDGACRIKDGHSSPLMERAKELGQKAIAITDHGVMYGAIDFYHAAKDAGIKPVIGCEVYVAPRTRFDKVYEYDGKPRHLVLLCKNMTGYKNLIKIVSAAFIEGFYIKPRVDYELLTEHSEGIIALSACLAGEVATKILGEGYEAAKEAALRLNGIFGDGNFYLEVQDHGIPEQAEVNRNIIEISKETGIPVVATNDSHYIRREDAKMHDVLLCIQTGKTMNDQDRMRFPTDNFYLKSGDEMLDLFSNIPEAIENTVKIADMCNLEFEFGKYQLPAFKPPLGMSSVEYLRKLVEEGFVRRFPDGAPEGYRQRIEYEFDIISKMGFVDYFLIVNDFIAYAKQNGIPVGPGRGSGAASIIAYCLGITDIEPMKYALFFERFLNPDRVSMPDFDIDFCYMRRQEVIDYVIRKYGEDKVAQIVTFGTMAAKGAVRDVGRVLGIPYPEVDAVAKQIPFELGMTLDKALETSTALKEMYERDSKIKNLINIAKSIEGMPRHASTHAAGVVITENPTSDYVPLSRNGDSPVAQYSMTTLEALGLLKMDFLGLRTLTVVSDAEKLIKKKYPEFSIYSVSHEDRETFDMLSKGETAGVFQIESEGLTNMIMNLKPETLEDITAAIALYRPGPMQYIPKYIESKHNVNKISYRHPLLKPILSVTYGCIIYQEQVMEIFRELAGYSLGKADMVRRAMAKKKMDLLKKERQSFIYGSEEENIKGAVANGVDEKTANTIFDEIMDFANYAFNKAHSVSYAMITYQTAYLKRHYPMEYMAALLTSVLDSSDKVKKYIDICREMGITVLAPDINLSDADFTVCDDGIRFGLAAVKNIGRGFINKVIEERKENGRFTTMQSFCERMAGIELNRRAVESLIKCGAFDKTGAKRSQLMSVVPQVVEFAAGDSRNSIDGQLNIFSLENTVRDEVRLPDIDEYSKKELLSMEKETTGLYISGHPMDEYAHIAENLNVIKLETIYTRDESGIISNGIGIEDGKIVSVAGIINSVKLKSTRSGSMMAYIDFEDLTGSIEMMAFSKAVEAFGALLKEDNAVFVRARVTVREDEPPKLICEEVYNIDDDIPPQGQYSKNGGAKTSYGGGASKIYIKTDGQEDTRLRLLRAVLKMFPGLTPVCMVYYNEEGKKLAASAGCASDNPILVDELKEMFGRDNVILK